MEYFFSLNRLDHPRRVKVMLNELKDHVQTCQKYDDEDDIELLRPLRRFRCTLPSLVLLKGLLAASGSVLKKTPGALRTQWTEYEIPELGSYLKPLPTPNESCYPPRRVQEAMSACFDVGGNRMMKDQDGD